MMGPGAAVEPDVAKVFRVVVVHGEGAALQLPDNCELVPISMANGGLSLGREGSEGWAALMDCDLLWIRADVEPFADSALDALLVAATACEVPIFSAHEIESELPGVSIQVGESLAQVIDSLDVGIEPRTPSGGLSRLQRYYRRMASIRGYETSDPSEGMLLLTEEIGELAHGIRKRLNLGRTHPYAKDLNVAEELADVQLFLLTLANLLGESLDEAVCAKERTNHRRAAARFFQETPRRAVNFVAVEGLIGAGKTTTARLIAEAINVSPVLERVESHPFIESFYADGFAHVLELELAFILMRWHDVRQSHSGARVVTDFSPFKDLVFTEMLVADTAERDLIHRMYSELWERAPRPDCAVFLDLPPCAAMERIQSRGRSFEGAIDLSYLEALRSAYLDNLRHLAAEVVVIKVSGEEDERVVARRALDAIAEIDDDWHERFVPRS